MDFKEGDLVCFEAWPLIKLLVIEIIGDRITVLSMGFGNAKDLGTYGMISTVSVKSALLTAYPKS